MGKQSVPGYFELMTYPVVSRICLPHIEQRPFLYAHPFDVDQHDGLMGTQKNKFLP